MRRNKAKLAIIISIIIVVILIVSILLCITFFTDIFKSNKEKFFKSAMSTVIDDKSYANIEKYIMKQANTPFESSGTYSTYVKDSNETILSKKEQSVLNKTNITFKGKVDLLNELISENVSIDYTNDTKIPINIIINKELTGIQSDYLNKKYFTINTGLDKLIDEYLNNNESKDEIEQKYEEIKEIFEKNSKNYINAVMNAVDDSKFSTVDEAGTTGYKVIINEDDIKNMVIAFLETLKNDQEMLNKINEVKNIIDSSAENITPQSIEEWINDVNSYNNYDSYYDNYTEDDSQTNIEITAFIIDKSTSKISIKAEDTDIEIIRQIDNNKLEAEISTKNEQVNVQLKVAFDGFDSDNASENYEINYNINGIDVTHRLTRNVTFVPNIDIDKLNEDNSINLDQLEPEQKQDFETRVAERVEEVNKMQMEELGIENNILIYEVPFVGLTYGALDAGTSDILSRTTQAQEENARIESKEQAKLAYMSLKALIIQNSNDNANYNALKNIDSLYIDVNKNLRGNTFEECGTEEDGNQTLSSDEKTNGWKTIEIEDENKIIMIYTSNYLKKDLKYTITLDEKSATMDEEPIEIEKSNENYNENISGLNGLEDIEKKAINSMFEPYSGKSVKGSQINELIETIKEVNESEENHKVKIKANVSNWDYDSNKAKAESAYKVTCEYDEEGYVNTIILEDAEN